jgi:hypothetical protein
LRIDREGKYLLLEVLETLCSSDSYLSLDRQLGISGGWGAYRIMRLAQQFNLDGLTRFHRGSRICTLDGSRPLKDLVDLV